MPAIDRSLSDCRYCDAVAGGVNAYTDGMMENGISTDDFLALCEYVGLVPVRRNKIHHCQYRIHHFQYI